MLRRHCITALTVQTTQGVRAVEAVNPEIVRATLRELAADLPVSAVRIGMLGSAAVVEAVLEFLQNTRPPNVVLDPVVRSSSGAELLDPEGVALLKGRMLPLISVVTPNVDEVVMLSGLPVPEPSPAAARFMDPDTDLRLRGAIAAGEVLLDSGVKAVVVTGGHLEKPTDVLLWRPGAQLHTGLFLPGESNRARLTARAALLPPHLPVLWRLEFRFLKQWLAPSNTYFELFRRPSR